MGSWLKKIPLLWDTSLNNIKILLKLHTTPSLFQWKTDNERSLVLRLPQIPLPPRAKLGENLRSEPKPGRSVRQAWSLEKGKGALCKVRAGYSHDAPWWVDIRCREPQVEWLSLGQELPLSLLEDCSPQTGGSTFSCRYESVHCSSMTYLRSSCPGWGRGPFIDFLCALLLLFPIYTRKYTWSSHFTDENIKDLSGEVNSPVTEVTNGENNSQVQALHTIPQSETTQVRGERQTAAIKKENVWIKTLFFPLNTIPVLDW